MRRPRYWPWLLLLVPVAFGLMRLRFDVEVLDLLPPELKVVQGLKLYQEHFANARELIITVKAADADHAEEAARSIAETLRAETTLVESVVWQPPWMEHPEQAAELIACLWLNQPREVVQALTNRVSPTNLAHLLMETKEELASSMSPQDIGRLSYDPLGLTRLPESTAGSAPAFGQGQEMFASADGSFRIMFVKAGHDLNSYKECATWLKHVKSRIPGSWVQIGYTGRPAFVAEVAGGMEKDITASVGGTAVIIALLFWLAHRRWKPMAWLLTLLALILGSSLGLGGLFFGRINVVSMGFAAILLGLAVDYAVVHYQEALAHPDLTIPQIRRAIAPSIFWAAVTTITAFLVLNFGGLPGLGQLGSLVGLGVALSACVMIFAFLPPLFPDRWTESDRARSVPSVSESPKSAEDKGTLKPGAHEGVPRSWIAAAFCRFRQSKTAAFLATAFLITICAVILYSGLPRMDPTANALRPRNSQAYAALDEIKNQLNQKREPLWVLVAGNRELEVANRLERLEPVLARAVSNNIIDSFTLPTPLWPRRERQTENRLILQPLIQERSAFHEAASANGFAESSLALADRILDTWQAASTSPGTFWPTNPMSRWIFEKVVARTPTNFYALGFINPATNQPAETGAKLTLLENEMLQEDTWLSGWELLGRGIFSSVKQNMWKLVVPMISLVLLSLVLAFRAWQEVTLSILVLGLSGICLLTAMRLAGWSWNLLNLMALPLILGTGVDYSIFMQLALRRYRGDLQMAHQSVGRALLLCGGTAIAGFGSLAWSSNAGMASLGQVCAVGIAGNMLISVLLLPVWWQAASRRR
jgi:predicted RND superfamily exporter protein